jgi:hypothetical protein
MWFSQAKAQFRCSRITLEAMKYDHVLMKLPEDVVMSVRSLITEIEADPAIQATSYQLLKTALLGSYGKMKWQMAKALLDHPDLADRRPSAMMAEMFSLRFETSAPVRSSLLCSFVGCRPPSETTLPPRTTKQGQRWLHTYVL